MQPREAAHKWPGGGSPGAINTANPNVGAERNHPSRPQVPHPQWPPPSHSRQPHSLTGRRRGGVERVPAASVLNIVEESTPASHRHHAHAHPSRRQRRPYRHHVADELPTCRAPRRSDRGRDGCGSSSPAAPAPSPHAHHTRTHTRAHALTRTRTHTRTHVHTRTTHANTRARTRQRSPQAPAPADAAPSWSRTPAPALSHPPLMRGRLRLLWLHHWQPLGRRIACPRTPNPAK